MTKLLVKTGATVWTELSADEVRFYLSEGSKTGSINGYTAEDKLTPVYIAVHSIVLVYR